MVQAFAIVLIVAVSAALIATELGRRRRRPPPVAAPAGRTAAMRPASGDPLARVLWFLRNRRWARLSLSGLSIALLLGAVGMLGYPFATNLWQDRLQDRLEKQLASPELEQAYRDRRVEIGDSLTRLRIPSLKVDVVVVEGTTMSALRAGAGHYPQTPLPCEDGNVAIAGHRTTFGRPFHNLDRLQPGDVVILDTPVGSCTYEVAQDPFVVAPTDMSVVGPTPEPSLTLTTCHPKGSAAKRLIVRATLQGAAVDT